MAFTDTTDVNTTQLLADSPGLAGQHSTTQQAGHTYPAALPRLPGHCTTLPRILTHRITVRRRLMYTGTNFISSC